MHFVRFVLVGLWLCASSALAQKVVVLELDGDTSNRLRSQIEASLRSAAVVEVVSLEKYQENAAKKKLKGGAAMTSVGVARTAKLMRLDAAVSGEVSGSTYNVVIYDALGQSLWTKSLPLRRGLLSDDLALKLARAVAAAADQGASHQGSQATDEAVSSAGDEITPDEVPLKVTPRPPPQGLDLTDARSSPNHADSRAEVEDPDLENPEAQSQKPHSRPSIFRAWVAGTTTWRAQCLRPGATSCRAYDALTPKPLGIQVDFSATVPYLGVLANIELFPLAQIDNRFVQGLGLLGEVSYGASVTKIVEASDQGTSPEKRINSADIGWAAQLAYRFFFGTGVGTPQALSYVGLRAGLQSRSFNIDPDAGVSLPSSQRALFPSLGADVSFAVLKYLRFEASLSFFVSPKVGPNQIIGYGDPLHATGGVVSHGLGFEGGLAGQLWGPLGWQVRGRYLSFGDRYYGKGQKWTVCTEAQCGGVGEESYASILWGLTASY